MVRRGSRLCSAAVPEREQRQHHVYAPGLGWQSPGDCLHLQIHTYIFTYIYTFIYIHIHIYIYI